MTPIQFRYWAKALSNFFFFLFVIAVIFLPLSTSLLNLPTPLIATSIAVAVTMLVLAAQITAMYRHWVELTEKRIKEESVNEGNQIRTQIETGRLSKAIFKSPWFGLAICLCLIGAWMSGSRVVRERFAADTATQLRQSESMLSEILFRLDLERERSLQAGQNGEVKLLPSEHAFVTRAFAKSVHFIDLYTFRHPSYLGLIDEEKALVQDLCRDLATSAMGVCVVHGASNLCDETVNPKFSVTGFLEDLKSEYCPKATEDDRCCYYVRTYFDYKSEIDRRRSSPQ